jgi:tRNA uridine 5-carboxymethylaminomethyl modification enzyme
MKRVAKKNEIIESIIKFFKTESIKPEDASEMLISKGSQPIRQKLKILNLILRPQISMNDLINNIDSVNEFVSTIDTEYKTECLEEATIRMKYEAYIVKEQDMANKINKLENLKLKPETDYLQLSALSFEAREKLSKIRPETIGQASRIAGISPADISILTVYLGR